MHRHAAVIGQPIAHSLSPVLHRAAYAHLGLPLEYGRRDLAPEELEAFLAACADGSALPDPEPGEGRRGAVADDGRSPSADASPGPWVGLSVTMPHKQAVAAAAATRSARVDLLGAANTLVWGHPEHGADGPGGGPEEQDGPDGRQGPWAHNTDVEGIVGALRFAGLRPLTGAETVGIVGNGGTAAAAVLAASLLDAGRVELFVRSPERAAPLAQLAGSCGLEARVRGLDELADAAPDLAAVVCTLPPRAADPQAEQISAGRSSGADSAVALAAGAPPTALPPLLDAAYDPWPSVIATAWKDAGGAVVSGLEMLLYQAVEQVRLFAAAAVAQGAEQALRERVEQADWAEVTAVMARAVGLPPRD